MVNPQDQIASRSFAPMIDNEHQTLLIPYPVTDIDRMNVVVDFFMYADPFRKWGIYEITEHWEAVTKEQVNHMIRLLKDSNLFVIFSKRFHMEFMLKDDIREDLIRQGSYENYINHAKE